MPFDAARGGRPFGEDFARAEEPAQEEHRQAVRRQARNLRLFATTPALRRWQLEAVRLRRSDGDRRQVEMLETPAGAETLVAAGELLIDAGALRRASIGRMVSWHGLEPHAAQHDALAPAVIRLRAPDRVGVRALADLSEGLLLSDAPAAVNHMIPLAPVGKGIDSPEPAPGLTARYDAGGCTGTRVAVIDTGIADQPRDDGWLTEIERRGEPDRGDPSGEGNIDPLDAFPDPPDGYLDLAAGHGTFVAGIIRRVAPQADIRVYRALDSDGVGGEFEVAAAMLQAVEDGAQILNLSLGSQTVADREPLAIRRALDLIRARYGRDVLVVAAAGNFGTTARCYPAACDGVIAVAGLTPELEPAPWSSRGWWVDFSTVAEGVRSTYVEGRESVAVDREPDAFPLDAWAVWSGTSCAAPQIAGALAAICDQLGVPLSEALGRLRRSGLPDRRHGFGVRLEILPGI